MISFVYTASATFAKGCYQYSGGMSAGQGSPLVVTKDAANGEPYIETAISTYTHEV